MRKTRLAIGLPLAALLGLLAPAPAAAQWYASVLLGGNHTQPATVTIEDPTQSLSVEFHDVHFSAQPLKSPQYSGWRFGRMLGKTHRLGVELEFIHMKAIADTSRTYVVTPGAAGGSLATSFATMSATVQRYQMTHGLNFALVNLVYRAPLRPAGVGRMSLDFRAGMGPTIPHAETTVLGESREQYEYGGLGGDGAVGLEMRLNPRFSLITEYKVTIARPEITLAHGTGRTTTLTHHVTGGLVINLTR